MKINNKKTIISVTIVILFIIITSFFILNHQKRKSLDEIFGQQKSGEYKKNIMTDDELTKEEISDTLQILYKIHYISINDYQSEDPNRIIADELLEAMNDVNKLKQLVLTTEKLMKSKNDAIATTGLALDVTSKNLIIPYEAWIKYLRGVTIETVELSEFQYQHSLFISTTHDSYLLLAEGVSLLPMVTINFAKDDKSKNEFNNELKDYFVTTMNNIFKDVLIEDTKFHQETGMSNVVPVIIKNYQNFFN